MASTIEIFICSAYKDEPLLDELEKHLSLLKQKGQIICRYERSISPGKTRVREIDRYLNTADIILLLISPDFMASDYCNTPLMERAMKRHEKGEARIIPIILRAVDWESAVFGNLQPLPRTGKPVVNWSSRDDAFLEITRGIRQVIGELTAKSPFSDLSITPNQAIPSIEDTSGKQKETKESKME